MFNYMGLFSKKQKKEEKPDYYPTGTPDYKIGDKVWVMYDNKPQEKLIEAIAWDSLKQTYRYYLLLDFDKDTLYRIRNGSSWSYQPRSTEMFKTKEELIEHLFNV